MWSRADSRQANRIYVEQIGIGSGMKARIIFGLSAALVLLAAGCQKEQFGKNDNTQNLQGKTYTAIMEQPVDRTKSVVTDEGVFSWENGDPISVLAKSEVTSLYELNFISLDVSATGEKGSFSLSSEYSNPTYATYPNIIVAGSNDGTLTGVGLSKNYENYTGSTNAAMYAKFSEAGTETDTEELVFKHLAGVLKLSFKNVPVGTTKMVFTAPNNKITDFFDIDKSGSDWEIKTAAAAEDNSDNSIIYNFTATTAENNTKTFYVPLPTGTYTGFTVQLFEGETEVYRKSTTQASYKLERRDLAILPELDCAAAPAAIDLSANGTANSYIVSESGTYSFKAVQGNSSTPVGEVAAVDVLWESDGTATAPEVGDLIHTPAYNSGTNTITFKTAATYKEGNALIAAKDASDKVLWSWHIWLTDTPEDQKYNDQTPDDSDNSYMMDRNLGAISADPTGGVTPTIGLLYQWGRKDPFLAWDGENGTAMAKSTGTWKMDVVRSTAGANNATISAYATEYPTHFIKGGSSGGDWLSSTDNSRWGATKTINDPCPPGYKVPNDGANTGGVWYDTYSGWDGEPGMCVYTTLATNLYDSNSKSVNFKGLFTGESENCFYPVAGYLNGTEGKLEYVGENCHCWSTSTYDKASHYFYFFSEIYFYLYFGYRSNGHSVRCLRE